MLISTAMKLDLRLIKPEGNEFNFSELAQDLELAAEGFEFPEPIEVILSAAKSGDEIIVQGRISSTIEMECARCLDIFEMELNPRVQFVIQLLDSNQPEFSDADDFVILPKTTGEFEISDRIRESIILELPLKPLCYEGCRGLCPMCGVNLNETECDCTPDKTDERWDSLKQLFDE
ncbi:MAG: hypothetical protein A2W25_09195 [candidate division Zixibacteria bacterium RBG_16_53_22]|nr:MAG: hypothetical protein A2W25_09195 [candidate division Zixibacteria bacterium RBG_16_53_22]